ncbi:MAG: LysR family transcriptional regulator [Peptococcaceae bacterium]|jgi:DNA-binding transcriptional LysR family regulator|nr:LysR family transcriptional regulator [Peptococcaceae bacterium]
MQLYQLEYTLAVAKHRSFSKAAEEMNISQSSLSQQIINLEKELGVSLFVRTTRSVHLTNTGEDFISHAARVVAEMNATQRCIQEYVSLGKGYLSIGIIPAVGYYPIPKLLASFNREYTGVKLSLIERQDDELIEMLTESKINAAIVQTVPKKYNFQAFPLYTDSMVLITSVQHPLAFRKRVSLKELRQENFIVPPPVSGHFHDLELACKAAGFAPQILMTCSSVPTILGLTREDIGITVLSAKTAAAGANDPLLSTIGITPNIERKLYLVIQNNVDISPVLKMFLKYVAQWISSDISA